MDKNEHLADVEVQRSQDTDTVKAQGKTSTCVRPYEDSHLTEISTRITITRLPPELHLKIFENLHCLVCSTCLGLTCKAFYAIHKAKHGAVGLSQRCYPTESNPRSLTEAIILGKFATPLHELLKQWLGPGIFTRLGRPGKFTPREGKGEMCTVLQELIDYDLKFCERRKQA
jgi:hypothetical protein